MIVNKFVLGSNPFFDAYVESDILGKLIFIGLVLLSVISWIVLIHKVIITRSAKKFSQNFKDSFLNQKLNPLGLDTSLLKSNQNNPFLEIYTVLKKQSLDILNKNRRFGLQKENQSEPSYLSPTDIDFVEAHLYNSVAKQTKNLEKNLFILSTVVTLAPFLGLLGTVWGILTTFSQLQSQSGGSVHQMVLGGLSLALATTVLGLLDAIPALIGYNYLKHEIKDFQTEMECFSNEILSSVEMQYRKVDVK